MADHETPRVVVVMGVSGSGKTTVGRLLAQDLSWDFFDADDFHPEANIRKMASGVPLNDEDRRPWLLRLRELIDERLDSSPAVVTCSALKAVYREWMGADRPGVALVFLSGSAELLTERLAARKGHFMPPGLLKSQLETLEPPGEEAVCVEVSGLPAEICMEIRSRLSEKKGY